jgi:hypothetical protein
MPATQVLQPVYLSNRHIVNPKNGLIQRLTPGFDIQRAAWSVTLTLKHQLNKGFIHRIPAPQKAHLAERFTFWHDNSPFAEQP